jgi:hypothetical protein
LPTYETLVRKTYRHGSCLQAFGSLLESPKDPELVTEAFEHGMSIAGCALSRDFGWISPEHYLYQDILSRIAFRLFQVLHSDGFYEGYNENTLFPYVYRLSRGEALNIVRQNGNRPKRPPKETEFFPQICLDGSESGVLSKIFCSEIPDRVLQKVREKIRFHGRDWQVCSTIAESLIHGQGVPTAEIRERWGTRRLVFLKTYVTIIIRMSLEEIREDVRKMPDSIDTLHEVQQWAVNLKSVRC